MNMFMFFTCHKLLAELLKRKIPDKHNCGLVLQSFEMLPARRDALTEAPLWLIKVICSSNSGNKIAEMKQDCSMRT